MSNHSHFHGLFNAFKNLPVDSVSPRAKRRLRLGVESMEDRTMPTAVPLTSPDGGTWVKIDSISVATKTNQSAASGVSSSVTLEAGKTYMAVAHGTGRISWINEGLADAEYIMLTRTTGPQDGSTPGYPWTNHGVRLASVVGGETSGNLWGAYQSDNQYVKNFVGQGTKVTGYYTDIPGAYADNDGAISVDIYANVPSVILNTDALDYPEGAIATLKVRYSPAISGLNPTVVVNWGDGTPSEKIAAEKLANQQFVAFHFYGDDRQPGDPNAPGQLIAGNFTPSDKNLITVTVSDPLIPDRIQIGQTAVTIHNVSPTGMDPNPRVPQDGEISKDGVVIIDPKIRDASNLPAALPPDVPFSTLPDGLPPHDLFNRSINWDDGKLPEQAGYNDKRISFRHDYNLLGELSPGEEAKVVAKNIVFTAADDDEPNQVTAGNAKVLVRLLPPELSELDIRRKNQSALEPIYEGQVVSLTGFIDHAGSANWKTVTINWGDGTNSDATIKTDEVGRITYSAEHTYVDNGPVQGKAFKPYDVTVTAEAAGFPDKKLTRQETVNVKNDIPHELEADLVSAGDADSDGVKRTISLKGGKFADMGAKDTHKVKINWGDGESTEIECPLG